MLLVGVCKCHTVKHTWTSTDFCRLPSHSVIYLTNDIKHIIMHDQCIDYTGFFKPFEHFVSVKWCGTDPSCSVYQCAYTCIIPPISSSSCTATCSPGGVKCVLLLLVDRHNLCRWITWPLTDGSQHPPTAAAMIESSSPITQNNIWNKLNSIIILATVLIHGNKISNLPARDVHTCTHVQRQSIAPTVQMPRW